jgi:C1A family cysteine protease
MKLFYCLALAILLSACQQATQPATTLFVPDNSYSESIPANAETLSSDAFAQRVKDGTLVLTNTKVLQEQARLREAGYKTNLASLKMLPKTTLSTHLLEAAVLATDPYHEALQPLENGSAVALLSLSERIDQAVVIHERSQDADNALKHYQQSYNLLPDDLKNGLPTVKALQGKSVAEIEAALALLDSTLGSSIQELEQLGLASDTTLQTIAAGNGKDNNGTCQPRELYKLFSWPLKNFLSPVKDQARRGTCWAFTTVAALESRELVQRDVVHNLSEQFLVNRVKQDWDSDDFEDGYHYSSALEDMLDNNQALPEETFWTYNPSSSRNPSNSDSDEAQYQDSCLNYSGTCSNTAHQSQIVCTTYIGLRFCGYETARYQSAGVAASEAVQIWSDGDPFRINTYRHLLASGYTIMASFDVRIGFQRPERGFINDFRDVYLEAGVEKDGDLGGHAVLIVGFIDNETISSYRDGGGFPLDIPGGLPASGGFFIIKNSWGCNFGDGGYVYVPAEYIEAYFYDLSILTQDATRSAKWQAYNGGGELKINLSEGQTVTADVRISKKLFEVVPPKSNSINDVTIQISSSVPGDQFIASDTFNVRSYTSSFTTAGQRSIQITAQLGATTVQQNINVTVINTAPTIELLPPGIIYAGEKTIISLVLKDKNETNPGTMCQRLSWSFTSPDIPFGSDGTCSRTIAFGQAGTRSFTVSTTDSEGSRTNQTFSVNVQPAPVNPYPRILDAWLHEPNRLIGNDVDAVCQIGARIPDGTLIDLTKPESSYSCLGATNEPTITRPYEASVTVENPDNEVLRYQWTFWEGNPEHSLETIFGESTYVIPYYELGTGRTPFTCGVSVTVWSPDTQRNKTQNVWSGQCIFYDVVPR